MPFIGVVLSNAIYRSCLQLVLFNLNYPHFAKRKVFMVNFLISWAHISDKAKFLLAMRQIVLYLMGKQGSHVILMWQVVWLQ